MRYFLIGIGLVFLIVILSKLLLFTVKWVVILGVVAVGVLLVMKMFGGKKKRGG